GRQFARNLASEGARIAALDRNASALGELEMELSGKQFTSVAVDVTDAAATAAATRELESKLGPTDLLIAAAGIGKETTSLNYSADLVADIIRVNLIGVSNS